MSKYYTVYKITNNINKKFYIGKHQTNDLNDGYMGSGKLIKAAIAKYGIENFTREILFVYDNEQEMNMKEKELVQPCSINEQSYNLNEGGNGGWNYINTHVITNEDRSRIGKLGGQKGGEALKEKIKNDEEFRENLQAHLKRISKIGGQKYKEKYPDGIRFKQSEQAIKNQKEVFERIKHQQGTKNSQYGTCWITNGVENKKIRKEDLDFWLNFGYYKGRVKGNVKASTITK